MENSQPNSNSRRFFNSVAITYLLVAVITLLTLATMDSKLPGAFILALVSPKFWRMVGEGFPIFMGVAIAAHIILYAVACRRKNSSGHVVQAILALVLNAGFYFCVFFVLLLSGLRH